MQYPHCPRGAKSEARLSWPRVFSGLPRAVRFNSLHLLLCFGENVTEVGVAGNCSCELTLVPVRGGWLETGFSGSDLARKGHKFSFLTHTKSLASGLGDKFLSPK